ncbi:MAG: LysR substrate-binding domain-containing protein [Polyangiaceae bacterium]|nr:LysR substrate-binding domain-containing protein [Polyangiaceae bacterium]
MRAAVRRGKTRGGGMDLNHIVSFLRVVESGSFTRAARALGVPTSTVSRQIAQLEEDLGVRLLQRTSRHVQLTDAGVAYHERVAPALSSLDEASIEIRDLQETPSGLVRLTAPADLSTDYLAEPIAEFSRLYPRIQVELLLTGRTVDLVAEGVDLAMRAGELRDGSLIARKLGFSELILAASTAYLERRGEPASLADLARHDCIGFRAPRGRATWSLQGPGGLESVDLDCRVSADEFSFVRALLLAGAGVAMAPRSLLLPGLREGALRRVLPGYELRLPGGIFLVYPSAKHLPRRVALLRDHLLRALPPLLDAPAGA